jgi:hypothetical protein
MAAEEIGVGPFKGKAQKIRILAENSQHSKLDHLVLTAVYEALVGQAWASEPSEVAGNNRTIGELAA